MLLTDKQNDSLSEFITTAFSRGALSSLSQLAGRPVAIDLSGIGLHPLSRLGTELARTSSNGEIATVRQNFIGTMSGEALLLMEVESALILANLMRRNRLAKPLPCLDSSSCEVVAEVGNILLNSYLGMCSQILQIQVSFSVPYFQKELLPSLLNSLVLGKSEVRYSLAIGTTFHLDNHSVSTDLILVSGVVSLSCLIKAVETWADLAGPDVKQILTGELHGHRNLKVTI